MIGRYSRPEMAALWTEEAKLGRWLEVEIAACRGWAARGVIPPGDLAAIEASAAFSVERTQEIERTTDHDVIAFLTNVAEHVGPASRWIHFGMTSSDTVDTAQALALKRAGELLVGGQEALTRRLRDRALEMWDTVCVGRTHGMHAEPTTFGLKLAGHAFESRRNEERLRAAIAGAAVGKLSGAVGTYATFPPDLEGEVLAALENVALWHERDISHSSVERVIAPDATIALDFALCRAAEIVEKLVVDKSRMRTNLEAQGGLVYSQRVLLTLTQAGLSREAAYRPVQKAAMNALKKGSGFREELARDPAIAAALPPARLARLFDPAPYLRQVDTIFARVFGPSRKPASRRAKRAARGR